jgi:hypothetical protein
VVKVRYAEAFIAFVLTSLVLVSVPLWQGGLGLSWDSMNHHVYLGWVANGARFKEDYFAAASQSYQFPYLYWPIYQLTRLQVEGWVAGAIWAVLHAFVSFPLWLISWRLIPGTTISDTGVRLLAVAFGIGNILVLRAADTSANDVLATIPWLFALALGLGARESPLSPDVSASGWRSLSCGWLGGASVALKLSNGVMVIFLPLVCYFLARSTPHRLKHMCLCLLGLGAGFVMLYGWWGWHLWQCFGNPVFPFADWLFEPLRAMLGWSEDRP